MRTTASDDARPANSDRPGPGRAPDTAVRCAADWTTLRNWAEEGDRVEAGRSSAPRSAESEEVRALRRRVAELERANEILKTSAAFFAQAEVDR